MRILSGVLDGALPNPAAVSAKGLALSPWGTVRSIGTTWAHGGARGGALQFSGATAKRHQNSSMSHRRATTRRVVAARLDVIDEDVIHPRTRVLPDADAQVRGDGHTRHRDVEEREAARPVGGEAPRALELGGGGGEGRAARGGGRRALREAQAGPGVAAEVVGCFSEEEVGDCSVFGGGGGGRRSARLRRRLERRGDRELLRIVRPREDSPADEVGAGVELLRRRERVGTRAGIVVDAGCASTTNCFRRRRVRSSGRARTIFPTTSNQQTLWQRAMCGNGEPIPCLSCQYPACRGCNARSVSTATAARHSAARHSVARHCLGCKTGSCRGAEYAALTQFSSLFMIHIAVADFLFASASAVRSIRSLSRIFSCGSASLPGLYD